LSDSGSELPPKRNVELNFDLTKLKDQGLLGVRRASAFLCFGLIPTYGEPPKSASLDTAFRFQFLPEPLPEELAIQIVAEYRTWLVGGALRELDLHCHLFLDAVWRTSQWASLHGKSVPSNFRVSEISQDTNAASKLKKVLKALKGDDSDSIRRLWTITNARNCLTHNAGMVSPRYANSEENKKLKISWLGQQLRLEQGDAFTEITPEGNSFQAPDPSKEAHVVMRFLEREKSFDVGTQILLTPHELHELCFFYVMLVERIMEQVKTFFGGVGILPPENNKSGDEQ
jgi:hypothetical protein